MSLQLKNKVAIVTGSSSGLGESIAIKFASQGAKVTLCGRDASRLNFVLSKVVDASGGQNDRFLSVQGDLNDQKVREYIVDQTVQKFGRLDILVANAGLSDLNTSLQTATEDSYNLIMDTNLKSVFFLIQYAIPHLEKTKGTIVTISSVTSTLASTNSLIYAISKAAVDHLTRCLAVHLGQKGISVNSVNPSFIPTRILRFVPGNSEERTQSRVDFERKLCVLQDRIGIPEDVAETVTFLASDAARFITGQSVQVDGGRSFGIPNGWSSFTQDAH